VAVADQQRPLEEHGQALDQPPGAGLEAGRVAGGQVPLDGIDRKDPDNARFLDDAGVMKREKRNNPEKAKPKKKAQERAAAAATAAAAPAEGAAPAAS
jgi:hypothetical protein